MLRTIWRFRAKPERTEELRTIYSSKGQWAELFSRSHEYRGTILLQDVSDPLVFVVIDRWASEDSFTRFRQIFGPDYEQLDEMCNDLNDEETLVGVFRDEVF